MKPVEPDEYLRAALRHAPDSQLAAPADVSAQIIAAAHRSASERPAASAPVAAPTAAARLRGWMLAWRLHRWGASGALATVIMAGFIGLLWRGEPPGPARDGADPAVAQLPATPSAAKLPAPAPAVAPSIQAAAPMPAPPPARTAQLIKPGLERMQADSKESSLERNADRSTQRAEERTDQRPSERAPEPAPEGANTRRETAAGGRQRDPSAAATVTSASRKAQAAEAVQPRADAPAAPPLATGAAAAADRVTAVAPAPALMAAPQRRAAAPAAAVATTITAPAAPPWRQPPQISDVLVWQPPARLQAPDAAWLARVAELTRGRWHAVQDAASASPPADEALQLQWLRDGKAVGQLWLDTAGARWCGAVPPCERAALSAQEQRELLAPLAR